MTYTVKLDEADKLVDSLDITKDPTGFPNQTDSIISFDDVTRTFSISPTNSGVGFDYYMSGEKYTHYTTQEVTISGANAEGLHFFYFDGDILYTTDTFSLPLVTEKVYTANIYWDEDNDNSLFLGEERHGLSMDSATHGYLHNTVGTIIDSSGGLDVTPKNPVKTGDGTSNDYAMVSVTNGILYDEDIRMNITHVDNPSNPFEQVLNHTTNGNAKIPMFYKDGINGYWREATLTDTPFIDGSSRIKYNKNTSGTWSLEDASDDDHYISTWLFACNNIHGPIIGIVGQREDTSLNRAIINNRYDLLDLPPIPVKEFIPISRLIYKTDSLYTTCQAVLYDVLDVRPVPTHIEDADRNYNDFEYYSLLNMFHTMSEAGIDNIRLEDNLRNAYIDTFISTSYVDLFHSTVLTGDSCVLDLNPAYSGDTYIQDYETLGQLSICNFEQCSANSWLDTTIQVDATTVSGISSRSGTYVGRIARKADPGNQTAYWTCLLQDQVTGIDIDTTSISIYINIRPEDFPVNDINGGIPFTLHLRGSGAQEEFYTSTQYITEHTNYNWVKYTFSIENCTFRTSIVEVGAAIGLDFNNTSDIILYVDDMFYTSGTVRNTHGYFVRTPLETVYNITGTLTDRNTDAPIETGYLENHISLDGGVHFKKNISLTKFISSEAGGEIYQPDVEYKYDIVLSSNTNNFVYSLPDGETNLDEVYIHRGEDHNHLLAKSDLLSVDDFSTDTTSNYTSVGDAPVYSVTNNNVELSDNGNSIKAHLSRVPTNSYDSEQYISALVSLKDSAAPTTITQFQTAAICVRTTNNSDIGYWAGLYSADGITTEFVLGKDDTIVATGTVVDATPALEYLIEIAVQGTGANNINVTGRIFDSTGATFYESLTYTDDGITYGSVWDTGNLGFFSGSTSGNADLTLATFDNFTEYYGWGEYRHIQSTPDYVYFIPGREPGILSDNFDDNSFDTNKWTSYVTAGSVTEQNNRLEIVGNTGWNLNGIISDQTFNTTNGLEVQWTVYNTLNTNLGLFVGFNADSTLSDSANQSCQVYMDVVGNMLIYINGSANSSGYLASDAKTYTFRVVYQNPGWKVYCISPDDATFSSEIEIYSTVVDSTGPFYFHAQNIGTTMEWLDDVKIGEDIKSYYFKEFVGDWDYKKSLVIIAHFRKYVKTATQIDTPEIRDFIQIAKVTEE